MKPSVRRGAAVVEFAIVSSVLFMFILGLIELGRGYMVKHELTEAARLGCRTAVVEGKSNSDINTAVSAYLSNVGLSVATTQVQVNGRVMDASRALSEDVVTIIVSVPVSQITWVPGGSYLGGTITGRFSMRRE